MHTILDDGRLNNTSVCGNRQGSTTAEAVGIVTMSRSINKYQVVIIPIVFELILLCVSIDKAALMPKQMELLLSTNKCGGTVICTTIWVNRKLNSTSVRWRINYTSVRLHRRIYHSFRWRKLKRHFSAREIIDTSMCMHRSMYNN
jgi:hypothetical protein